MGKIKVLNLYAGIGGNRKLWSNDEIEVTAVEFDPEIAKEYQRNFPNDKVIVGCAKEYLLKHFQEFGFIWASPPCQTHSRTNYFLKGRGIIRYPDMGLYEIIILLKTHFQGKWVIENVIPYYEQLMNPKIIGRHCFWSNFNITLLTQPKDDIGKMCGKNQKAHNIPLSERNAVNSELGKHIYDCAFKEKQHKLIS